MMFNSSFPSVIQLKYEDILIPIDGTFYDSVMETSHVTREVVEFPDRVAGAGNDLIWMH
jgi:hypothetical protein